MTPLHTPLDLAHAAFVTGGEDEARRFYRLLADAPLLLVLEHEPVGDAITPKVFDLTDGPVLLAFDTDDRLAGFQDSALAYISLPGRVIAAQLAGQGLWLGLNLGSGAASETLLPPEAMAHLLTLLDVAPHEALAKAAQFTAPIVPDRLDEALRFALVGAQGLAAGAVLAGVVYQGGGRGHVLALVGADDSAQPALARAMAEALSFAGLEAASLDVTFLNAGAEALAQMARVGRIYDIPQPVAAAPADPTAAIPKAPGSDPAKPPILR